MKAFKGFNKDLQCRDFQFEIGKEYTEDKASLCNSGFHACENPLNVFDYYPPATSRYCEVELDGVSDERRGDSKVCGKTIKVGAEIGIPGLVKAFVEYTKSRTTFEHTDPKQATAGSYGAATAGSYGAATAGDSGAATAGYKGAATAGYKGAATSRGSVCVGEYGVGLVRGNGVKAKGGLGAVLVICVENDSNYDLKEWKAVVVDGETVKADTWYTLENGEFVEAR